MNLTSLAAQQRMIRAGQTHHLEPDRFASEVAAVTEQDIEPDPANGRAGEAGNDVVEDRPGWLQVLGLEADLGHGVAVEDVDAATAVDENSRELARAPRRNDGGVEDEGVTTRTRHDCRVILSGPGDRAIRPMHILRLGGDDVVHLLPKEALASLVVDEAGEDDVGRILV